MPHPRTTYSIRKSGRLRMRRLLACAALFAGIASGQYGSSIVAGGGPPDGASPTAVAFSLMDGMAADSVGNLYVAAAGQNRVYKITTNGTISTFAGDGTAGYSGDNTAAAAAKLN